MPANRWLRAVLVVIAAAGAAGALLGALAANVVSDRPDPRRQARTDVQHIAGRGVDAFKVMRGRYPTTEEGLRLLIREGFLKANRADGTLWDPWAHEYVYRCPGTVHPQSFDVLSYGADGKAGGHGEDADVVNE